MFDPVPDTADPNAGGLGISPERFLSGAQHTTSVYARHRACRVDHRARVQACRDRRSDRPDRPSIVAGARHPDPWRPPARWPLAGGVTGADDAVQAASLGGTLSLDARMPIDALTPGETFTLLTSKATTSATFANGPHGALIAIGPPSLRYDASIAVKPASTTATVTSSSPRATSSAPMGVAPITWAARTASLRTRR
jgi:hypothetical protein